LTDGGRRWGEHDLAYLPQVALSSQARAARKTR
jgi:hypothetical protein